MKNKDVAVPVADRSSEKSAYLTNILMTVILTVGAYFGDGILSSIKELNTTVNLALVQIATIQETDRHQDESIKKLERWSESHLDRHDRERQ